MTNNTMTNSSIITFMLNDQPHHCPMATKISDIVAKVAGSDKVAVALNEQILPKNDWSTAIQAGDSLLIFEAIAGG